LGYHDVKYSRVYPKEIQIDGFSYCLAIVMGYGGHIASKLHAFAEVFIGGNVFVLDDNHCHGQLPDGKSFTMQVLKVLYLAKKHCGKN